MDQYGMSYHNKNYLNFEASKSPFLSIRHIPSIADVNWLVLNGPNRWCCFYLEFNHRLDQGSHQLLYCRLGSTSFLFWEALFLSLTPSFPQRREGLCSLYSLASNRKGCRNKGEFSAGEKLT
ncbi:hypothetical protein CEXT_717151 [Caerostris extrusa]|uniref:Uncharacterized protein n=1 Tax=Caerostris extrusa TaxID=172846 RepID=A0AAV4P3K9_CAEEX|nr:hypothetical protein CEXT_717151 [Caerostris extrusa]